MVCNWIQFNDSGWILSLVNGRYKQNLSAQASWLLGSSWGFKRNWSYSYIEFSIQYWARQKELNLPNHKFYVDLAIPKPNYTAKSDIRESLIRWKYKFHIEASDSTRAAWRSFSERNDRIVAIERDTILATVEFPSCGSLSLPIWQLTKFHSRVLDVVVEPKDRRNFRPSEDSAS